MAVFDTMERSKLQAKVLSGEIDSDCLLQDLVEWVTLVYYNLFANLNTGEHRACPVSRRGNAANALRQSFKKSALSKLIKKSTISEQTSSGLFSHLFFTTLTIDHNVMSRDEANRFITTKGKGISRFFARMEKALDGGYSKVIVKESTTSGYPAVHIITGFLLECLNLTTISCMGILFFLLHLLITRRHPILRCCPTVKCSFWLFFKIA